MTDDELARAIKATLRDQAMVVECLVKAIRKSAALNTFPSLNNPATKRAWRTGEQG